MFYQSEKANSELLMMLVALDKNIHIQKPHFVLLQISTLSMNLFINLKR